MPRKTRELEECSSRVRRTVASNDWEDCEPQSVGSSRFLDRYAGANSRHPSCSNAFRTSDRQVMSSSFGVAAVCSLNSPCGGSDPSRSIASGRRGVGRREKPVQPCIFSPSADGSAKLVEGAVPRAVRANPASLICASSESDQDRPETLRSPRLRDVMPSVKTPSRGLLGSGADASSEACLISVSSSCQPRTLRTMATLDCSPGPRRAQIARRPGLKPILAACSIS